jgi:hypothetical protein
MGSLIPQREKKARQQITVKLNVDQLRMLDSYRRFINDSRDYIISQALDVVFRKDKDFMQWLQQNSLVAPRTLEAEPHLSGEDMADRHGPQAVREKEPEQKPMSAQRNAKESA